MIFITLLIAHNILGVRLYKILHKNMKKLHHLWSWFLLWYSSHY